MAIQMHFFIRNVWYIVIILTKGNLPHLRCSRCDIMVSWRALNGRHHATAHYGKVVERKRRQMAEVELRDSTERAFEAYGKPLETVSAFKYLGRVMTMGDDN